MLAPSLYFVTLTLFGFTIFAAAQMPDSTWLVACICPVFLALIIGIFMWVFAWSEFGMPVSVGSLVLAFLAVRLVRRSLTTGNMFVAICAATVAGLICARFAFIAADIG
jgi:hypothetical protein